MKSLLLGVAMLLGVTSAAEAKHKQPADPTVVVVAPEKAKNPKHHKQNAHQKQMKQAIKDGRITPDEAKRLRMEKQRIHQMKQIAAADGVVTPKEQKQIAKAKKKFHHHKEQAMTNGKTR